MIRQHRILIAVLSLIFLVVALPAHAQVSQPACALTSEMIGGQGFVLDGQGFVLDGQGFTWDGQGFVLDGQGFTWDGQGFTWDGQGFTLDGQGFVFDGQGFVLDGQGFTWDGQGFNLSGQGFVLDGQGFTWDGQGFVLDGQGTQDPSDDIVHYVPLDYTNPFHVAYEVSQHIAPETWGTEHLNNIGMKASPLYGTVPSAVIIVDIGEHLNEVKYVFDQLAADAASLENGFASIEVETIDISNSDINYRVDGIADAISDTVNGLLAQDINNIVINMSLAFIPCEDTITTPSGYTFDFNFDDFITDLNASQQPNPTPQSITPIAECVYESANGHVFARFGYENHNTEPIMLASGGNQNRFRPSPQYRDQPAIFEPGIHTGVVEIRFSKSSITWELVGPDGQLLTATAYESWLGTENECANALPEPTEPIEPILECVYEADNGEMIARFGYYNWNDGANGRPERTVYVPSGGRDNKFTPNPGNRGQVTHFLPGRQPGIFEVPFGGRDITWTLASDWVNSETTVTATPEPTNDCTGDPNQIIDLGDHILGENVPENDVLWTLIHLLTTETLADDTDTSALKTLLATYLENSVGQPSEYNIVAVVSSGNYRPWYALIQGLTNSDTVEPLSPARWSETIAVSASLGESAWEGIIDPNHQYDPVWLKWFFSHDGDIMARGAGYAYAPNDEIDTFIAGTSFSAPSVSLILAHYFTFPDACVFQNNGVAQPPVARDYPTGWANRHLEEPYVDSSGLALDTPLWCNVQFNDAPIAGNDLYNTDEDVVINTSVQELPSILNNDIDPNDDAITLDGVIVAPTNGTLAIGVDGHFTYTPNPDFNGVDSFEYQISDVWGSATAIVTIIVNAVNDAPIAVNDLAATNEDEDLVIAAVTLLTNDTDIDGGTLSVTGADSAINGTVSFDAETGNVTFSPTADYNGAASFNYAISDGNGGVGSATVNITVNPVNDTPIANSQAVAIDEDIAFAITLTGSDVDGDGLTFLVTSNPINGSLSGTIPNLTYTPTANYHGSDSFKFVVNDSQATSVEAIVTITINSVNDAPVANVDLAVTDEDVSLTVVPTTLLINDTDVEGDTLSVVGAGEAINGTVSFDEVTGNITFLPASNYHGTGSFNYAISDGNGGIASTSVIVTVNPINDAPIANNGAVVTDEDFALAITLTGSDLDGDALTFAVTSNPTNGQLSGVAPNLTYTPAANWNGTDSFKFAVSDGQLSSAEATVTITVNPVNDAPDIVIVPDGGTIDEDGDPIDFTVTVTDIDSPLGNITVGYTVSEGGSVTETNTGVTFTPDPDFCGTVSLTITASDGNESSTVTVYITVTCVDDTPDAVDDIATTLEDVAVSIDVLGNDSDADEGFDLAHSLTVSSVTQAANGTVANNGNNVTYTPNANWSGTDSFTYTVIDNTGLTDTATVTVTVIPVDDPPNCSAITTSPDAFGPPVNHRMEQVTINFSGIDTDSDVTFLVTSIFQDEPVGKDAFDGQIIDASAGIVELRVERNGGSNGRVYTIYFTASDGTTSCNGAVQVRVDHDAVDDGPDYDSTDYSSTP